MCKLLFREIAARIKEEGALNLGRFISGFVQIFSLVHRRAVRGEQAWVKGQQKHINTVGKQRDKTGKALSP